MSAFEEVVRRLKALIRTDEQDRRSDEEFQFHIAMETEYYVKAGYDPKEAKRRALAAFGSRAAALEYTRDARSAQIVRDAGRDFSLALRQLRQQAAFSMTTILTIALGIGSVTAIWSVVDGVLLRQPPVDLNRLAMVWQTDRASDNFREPSSWPDFVDFVDRNESFEAVAAFVGQEPTLLTGDGEGVRLQAVAVTASYFDLVGAEPTLGRTFADSEAGPGGASVAILGEELWRSQFNATPSILGEIVVLDEVSYEVIGVLPEIAGFGLDQIHGRADYHAPYSGGSTIGVWLPIQADIQNNPRSSHPFLVAGRLGEGASYENATAEAERIGADLEATYPESNTDRGFYVESLDRVILAPFRPTLWLLLGGVALVVVVAFSNVTNLVLARGTTRVREVAVRTAMGAGLGRLARQILVENALLTAAGAMVGVGVAFGLLRALLSLAPVEIPRIDEVTIDGRVLLLTLVVSLFGVFFFSIVPIVQARRVDVLGTILGSSRGAAGSPRSRRVRVGLVVAQLALSVSLVIFAGLLTRSLWNIVRVDPGFHTEGILKAQYQLPTSRYPRDFSRWPNIEEIHGFNDRVLRRVKALPGVASAAIAGTHPLDAGFTNSFEIVGREEGKWPEISVRAVSPEYFATLGLTSLEGRVLSAGDGTADDTVAVINREAAEQLFEGRAAIGQSVRFWGTSRRIVGVVENERIHGIDAQVPIALYAPLAQLPMNSGVLLVRVASGDPMAIADGVTASVRKEDPALGVYGVERLEETLAGTFAERRFAMLVVLSMAGVTLLLSLFGVHGVLSYAAAQRRREMGIRAALGARRIDVAGLVVRNGLAIGVMGTALGLAIALAGSRYLSSLLFEVAEADGWTYLVVALVVLAVAGLASWIPARRAAKVEVVEALRAE